MALNLEKQLVFYGSYHHDTTNIAIHMFCVPTLLFTWWLMSTNTGAIIPWPEYLTIPNLPPDLSTILALIYSGIYILMEPVAGCLVTPILLTFAAAGHSLSQTHGLNATWWALGIHVASWVGQFIGHGAFEHRAPALLDNLVQALVLAPFFVWMEILFALGYRPELKSRVEAEVEKKIRMFRSSEPKVKVESVAVNGVVKS